MWLDGGQVSGTHQEFQDTINDNTEFPVADIQVYSCVISFSLRKKSKSN